MIDARVVDEQVDPTEAIDCRLDQRLAGFLVDDVGFPGSDRTTQFACQSVKLDKSDLAEFTKVIETDLYGVVHMSRAAIAHLRASKGCIVNVSSMSGLGGDWNHSFYCAAKGAVSNFTRALALDEAKHGVRVNAVNPSLPAEQ